MNLYNILGGVFAIIGATGLMSCLGSFYCETNGDQRSAMKKGIGAIVFLIGTAIALTASSFLGPHWEWCIFVQVASGLGAMVIMKRLQEPGSVAVGICTALTFLGLWSFMYDRPHANQVFLARDADGNVLAVHPSGKFVHRCRHCIAVPWKDALHEEVTPITQNPKARRIAFIVEAEIFDHTLYFRDRAPMAKGTVESPEDRQRFQHIVLYELKEFTNEYSTDLAPFHNQYDEDETQRLDALIRAHMNPRLAPKGVRIAKLVNWSAS